MGSIKQTSVGYKVGGFDPRNYRVSFDKIEKALDFKPFYSVEESVMRLINSINNHLYSDIQLREYFYGNYYISEEK